MMGMYTLQEGSLFLLLNGFLFTFFLLAYIVLLNDYADIHVDTLKRKMFPDAVSPKTIPDGILPKKQVLVVGICSAILCVLVSIWLDIYLQKVYAVLFAILCIVVFAFYSLPPVKLNYRGGGEFLEMMGVGVLLPYFHFSLYVGFLFPTALMFLLSLTGVLSLTSAIASGLSDEESDREGGKTTLVTLLGNDMAKQIIFFIFTLSYFFFLLFFITQSEWNHWVFVSVFILFYLYEWKKIQVLTPKARTNAFEEQRVYKDHIHYLIWFVFFSFSVYALIRFLVEYFGRVC